MLTRREFLGAGLGAAVAARAYALPGDKMRYAMSGHQFRTTPPHPETGIKMAARYGYHGIEPFQDDIPQYLKQPPDQFKKVLDASGLALCTVGSGGRVPRRLTAAGDDREQCRPRPLRGSFRMHASEGQSEQASQCRQPEPGERQNACEESERGRQANRRCRHQVRVPSARVDARGAATRAGHDDGDDRSRTRVSRARHRPCDVRRHRPREVPSRLLLADRGHPSQGRGGQIQHRQRLERSGAERRGTQPGQPL